MLNRVYIDNYKCFVNFEFQPQALELLVGGNGTGKTTLFDVLETFGNFVSLGTESSRAFPARSLTAWRTRTEQTFELGLLQDDSQYQYQLVIRHDHDGHRNRIQSERLSFGGRLLYEFDGTEVRWFCDDGSPGASFPFQASRSAISTIPERSDNRRLTVFRERMERIYVFSPDPLRMTADSATEVAKPDRRLHDVASWLRHLSQESVDTISGLRESLREVLEDLISFRLERAGQTARVLKFEFQLADDSQQDSRRHFDLPFDLLSDGQRVLVALFTIAHAVLRENATICIDEPENYVALREIQPWLIFLKDRVEDCGGQCILISHHPELINYLAAGYGRLLFRNEQGMLDVKRFEPDSDNLILPAELIAQGWE